MKALISISASPTVIGLNPNLSMGFLSLGFEFIFFSPSESLLTFWVSNQSQVEA